ncbi:MAG: hypothetical protein IKQ11_01335 [Paludibacteraceae bacterium]|nr:hypothetical protein [Paludibacteraceae bacterium]
MKRLAGLFLVLLFASVSLTANARESHAWGDYRHSISITAGCPSGYFLGRELLVDIWVSAADHAGNSKYYGTYGMEYHCQCLSWLRVGFKALWEGDSHDVYTDKEKTTLKGHSFGHTAALMPSIQFTYLNLRYVQLYAGVDVGAELMLRHTRYEDGYSDGNGYKNSISYSWLPALNVTPFGVSVGNDYVYGMLELNVGSDAIVKAGLGFRL